MASDYLHNSPWKKKSNEDEEIPESIRRPEGYVDPKKEAPKRDPEKEKAQWEQTPEGIRRPAAIDFESFGLRDALDKNVKMMSDEEIAAERAAEKEKRAALIQPKKEQKKEEAKADPKQEQHHAESAAVSQNVERPFVTQPQPTVTATTKYEIINGQEIRERMRDFINSSPELKNISSEDRAEIIKRLGDSKTAEEMRNKRFLIGEVNGQPMMHLLSEQESEKFNVLSGKKRDQYAAQLLESESKTLGSLVTDTQIKMIQEQNREDSREKAQAVTTASNSQKTKNEFSYASSPLELLLQILFKMFGLDFMNKSSQQQSKATTVAQNVPEQQQQQSQEPIQRVRTNPEQHIKEVSNIQVKADGGKYHMVAIVDGKEESREITELQYGKFYALDDRSRLRLLNKVFGIADGQSVKVADKAIAMETDQDNSVKRSAESGKQAQGQSWKNSDYAALAAMNFEQEEMNKSQQEHRSNGLRI